MRPPRLRLRHGLVTQGAEDDGHEAQAPEVGAVPIIPKYIHGESNSKKKTKFWPFRFKEDRSLRDAAATCVCISVCGNFVVVGSVANWDFFFFVIFKYLDFLAHFFFQKRFFRKMQLYRKFLFFH